MNDEWKPWQIESAQYFGKHDKRFPANVYGGYKYDPLHNGLTDLDVAISRAIPVNGAVEKATWNQSPQVRYWLDPPRPTLWQRFRRWLDQ